MATQHLTLGDVNLAGDQAVKGAQASSLGMEA